MNNALFIADQDSRCGKKITDIFLLNDYNVIQTVVNKNTQQTLDGKESEDETTEQKLTRLDWNCFSTISPKNMILQIKQHTTINRAAVILTPPEESADFVDQSHIEIQKSIDFYFRSQITIIKEIINELKKNTPSHLYLILNSKNRDQMYTSIYRAFINSILKSEYDSLFINGIENTSDNPEQFAEYFLTLFSKERKIGGKWYKPLQVNSFFNSLSGRQ
jgi:hypothetical protein